MTPRKLGRCSEVMAAVLLLAGCSEAPRPVKPEPSSLRKVGTAELTGIDGSYGNHAWLGVRFAQAPAGPLRFRAPQPIAPEGKQDAVAFGAPCPQLGHPLGVATAPRGEPVGEEDCLFLNVYAPKMKPEQAAGSKLPVMVWFHGGGNVVGHASGYDGGNLAQREKLVVVTANYRLGPLGWFRHASLRDGASPEDASGNYGTLDQIAALRWVQQHIASFGGDPGNVTIFGESAGARDVIALTVAPPARGLFHRAIAQSGNVRVQDSEKAEAFAAAGGHPNSASEIVARLLLREGKAKDAAGAAALMKQMKPAELAQYLRDKPPFEIIRAYATEQQEGLGNVPNVFDDGAIIPKAPVLELLARGDGHAAVPMMLGTNRDESKTFMLSDPTLVRRVTPLYMRMRDPDRYLARAQALSLAWKVVGADAPAAAHAASGGASYVYRFDWDEEPSLLGADLSVMLGAGHGLEIPFVFGHFDLGPLANRMFTEENAPGRKALAAQMMGYWAEFARSGRPGKGSGGKGPEWTAYQPGAGTPSFMVFDTDKGGGVRLDSGALGMEAVIATVEQDGRLRTEEERCAVLRDPSFMPPATDPALYAARVEGPCKKVQLAANR